MKKFVVEFKMFDRRLACSRYWKRFGNTQSREIAVATARGMVQTRTFAPDKAMVRVKQA